ncbi:MAG: hypothetical protein CMI64_04180 [Pedosphaera sp.]|nr:hypothetical protein [Pedosphaera sp.]
MGKRNCAYEGCNALEFRTSGYCLRHKYDHPRITTSEPSPEVVHAAKEELKKAEEDFPKGPFVSTLLILGWLFPPILLLVIPLYMFKRLTSKEDLEPDGGNLDANSVQDEDAIAVGENSDDTEVPWWVVE